MLSDKTAPQLQVGGACTSVAVEIGRLEGQYPDVLQLWEKREKLLRQSVDWHGFRMNCEQVREGGREGGGEGGRESAHCMWKA